mmetsp:Transcript_24530/g.70415  ORF Transcript_24530/g.70415 Transcript_24530/m.70415 type:complete len:236 (-) Transcript_24530:364-1071(-)
MKTGPAAGLEGARPMGSPKLPLRRNPQDVDVLHTMSPELPVGWDQDRPKSAGGASVAGAGAATASCPGRPKKWNSKSMSRNCPCTSPKTFAGVGTSDTTGWDCKITSIARHNSEIFASKSPPPNIQESTLSPSARPATFGFHFLSMPSTPALTSVPTTSTSSMPRCTISPAKACASAGTEGKVDALSDVALRQGPRPKSIGAELNAAKRQSSETAKPLRLWQCTRTTPVVGTAMS